MTARLLRGVTRALFVLLLAPAALGDDASVSVGVDRVRWQGGLEALGREAARLIPAIREDVPRRLGLPPDPLPVEVTIVGGLDAMRREAGAAAPTWAVGLAQPLRGRVFVRADLLADGFGGGLNSTLRHEWVHVVWGRHARGGGRAIPLWVEEGMAEEIGGGASLDLGAALDIAAVHDRLIPFEELEERFPEDATRADLAYKQARSWVRFLVEKRDWDLFRRVLRSAAGGSSPRAGGESAFAAAIRSETGRGVGEWEILWKEAVKEGARPWFHLVFADLGQTVLAIGALASVGLFFALWRRRRRQIDAMDAGEPARPDEKGA